MCTYMVPSNPARAVGLPGGGNGRLCTTGGTNSANLDSRVCVSVHYLSVTLHIRYHAEPYFLNVLPEISTSDHIKFYYTSRFCWFHQIGQIFKTWKMQHNFATFISRSKLDKSFPVSNPFPTCNIQGLHDQDMFIVALISGTRRPPLHEFLLSTHIHTYITRFCCELSGKKVVKGKRGILVYVVKAKCGSKIVCDCFEILNYFFHTVMFVLMLIIFDY